MTAHASIYQRMSIARLRETAATKGEHQDKAARAYVDRLTDMELERRLDMRHNMAGWHPSSPGFGDGTGQSTEAVDAMYLAYEKGIVNSEWHDRAKRAFGTLKPRGQLALLLRAGKADRRLEGPFCATYDQMAAAIGRFAQMLDFPPVQPIKPELCRDPKTGEILRETKQIQDEETGEVSQVRTSSPKWVIKGYKDGQAIKRAAWEAKAELLLQAKAGVI